MSVYVGIACYGNVMHQEILGKFIKASKTHGVVSHYLAQSYSILPRNFNKLLCQALNLRDKGVTHFLLWHSDILPQEDFYVDKMLQLMDKHDADILSVIVPLKDQTGITSTALVNPDDHYKPIRYTLKQLMDKRNNIPATFTHPDILVNSGFMLIDITNPWIEEIAFDFEEVIEKNKDGQFEAKGLSEDWHFSHLAKDLGAKIFATREIPVVHVGGQTWYGNWMPLGTKELDD